MELQQNLMKDDNTLELANRNSLFQMLSFFDRQLPRYCAIDMFIRATLLDDRLYQIYFRPKNETSLITSNKEGDYSLIIGIRSIPLNDSDQQSAHKMLTHFIIWASDQEEILEFFRTTNNIDWINGYFIIYFQTPSPHPAIDSFLNSNLGLSRKDEWPYYLTKRWIFPVKKALNLQISCPNNVYVKSLETCHAKLVFDHWPHNKRTTVESIALGIDNLPSAGVFLKENNQLVSWMTCNPPTGMGQLHTIVNHRLRGYAKLVTQYLSKRLAQAGCVPYAHVHVENEVAIKFFQNLGFEVDKL